MVASIINNEVFTAEEVAHYDTVFATQSKYLRLIWAYHKAQLFGNKAFVQSIALEFIGQHSISKSSMFKDYAKLIDARLFVISLGGAVDMCEFAGITQAVPDPSSDDGFVVRRIKPAAWPKATERTIVLWDDFRRATQHVLNGAMQLLLEGEWNGISFPEGVAHFITSNPPSDGFAGLELDEAQETRMMTHSFNPSSKDFLQFAERTDCHGELLQFYAQNKTELQPLETNHDAAKSLKSWRTNGMVMRIYPFVRQDEELLEEVITAAYGIGSYPLFKAIKEGRKAVKLEHVLEDPLAAAAELINLMETDQAIVFGSLDMIYSQFTNDYVKITTAERIAIGAFIVALPNDYAVEVFKTLLVAEQPRRGELEASMLIVIRDNYPEFAKAHLKAHVQMKKDFRV